MAYTTIDDPSVYFQTLLYTGNATGSRALTNDGNSDLQPDWLWIKQRNAAKNHNIWDSSRGVTKQLRANLGNAEATNTTNDTLVSLDSDGFTLGDDTDSVGVNENSQTYVAWQWKANGGSTTTNDASSTGVGTIDSVYQVNSTAGFSIVTYTGNGSSGATFAHGLGVAPDLVFTKNRDTTRSWFVGHHSIGFNFITGHLNSNDDKDEDSVYWNNTAPSSTVVTLGNNEGGNESGDNFVAYCFKEIQGYSKFGSYTANNSTNGPFVYLGFKPAWIMVKNTSTASDWTIADNKREAGNPFGEEILFANVTDAETNYSGGGTDFLSNGFKVRTTGTNGVHNANNTSHKFVYMAFAEQPFVSSKGVPTTAR